MAGGVSQAALRFIVSVPVVALPTADPWAFAALRASSTSGVPGLVADPVGIFVQPAGLHDIIGEVGFRQSALHRCPDVRLDRLTQDTLVRVKQQLAVESGGPVTHLQYRMGKRKQLVPLRRGFCRDG